MRLSEDVATLIGQRGIARATIADLRHLLGCPPEADLLAHAKGIRFAADGYADATNDREALRAEACGLRDRLDATDLALEAERAKGREAVRRLAIVKLVVGL